MTGTPLIAAMAMLALLLGLWLIRAGHGMRRRRGLGGGKTASLDKVTLRSQRLGLTGRPDRLVKSDGVIIPEEWKSGHKLRPWHRAQMGVYLALVEDQLGCRPPHGIIVTGDGRRHLVENTAEVRAWVLGLAGQIRAARAKIATPIAVSPVPGQCPPCGMVGHCGQARL